MNRAVVLSIIDQGMISAFNLLLNLAFIAYASPSAFGRFALVLAVSFLVISAQNALIVMPLNYLLPGRARRDAEAQTAMLTSANFVLALFTVPLGLGLGLLIGADAMLLVCIPVFLLVVALREYIRSYLVVTGHIHRTLFYDVTAMVASAVAILIFWTFLPPESAVLAGMALGNLVALPTCIGFDLKAEPWRLLAHLKAYRAVWRDTRWALQGAVQGEIVKRSYVFLVERMRDAAALGTLNAGRVGMSPLMLIGGAWARIARPRFVEHLRNDGAGSIASLLRSGVAIIAGASVLYGLALVFAWPVIDAHVFRDRYPDIATIVVCWWVYAFVTGIAIVPATLLEARQQFKTLAAVGFVGAVLIPILIFGLLTFGIDIAGVVLALAGAHLLELVVLSWFLMRKPEPLPDNAAMVISGE